MERIESLEEQIATLKTENANLQLTNNALLTHMKELMRKIVENRKDQ